MALEKSNTLGIVSNSPRSRTYNHLKEWTIDGRLKAGERLPSELSLAKKLNVSRTTIRRALEDLENEGIIVSEKRRRIVREHVKPSQPFLANSIVLIMDSPIQFDRSTIHGAWHSNFIHTGAVDAIRSARFDALTVHPDRIAGDMLQGLISEHPRGAIIMRSVLRDESGKHIAQAFYEGNVPAVLYGDLGFSNEQSDMPDQFDTVISDHEFGSYSVTKWLVQQGCKRILRCWLFPGHNPQRRALWLQRRDDGYERALKEARLPNLPALEIFPTLPETREETKTSFENETRMLAGYLVEHVNGAKPVDAIIAVSDSIVPNLNAALKVLGRVPNKDVIVAGYDNMWQDMPMRQWEPIGPAVTVDKRNLEIGWELMALLQERINGNLFAATQRRVVKPELVVRQSVKK